MMFEKFQSRRDNYFFSEYNLKYNNNCFTFEKFYIIHGNGFHASLDEKYIVSHPVPFNIFI